MELKWLEDFVALARTGSFSRAATDRHVTQPAFSRRIRALEHWLGVALVDRAALPVVLTEHGRQFLPTAQEVIGAAHAARHDFRQLTAAARRQVRLATLHTLSVHTVPGLVLPFLAAEPRAALEILPSIPTAEAYFEALETGFAHIVVAYAQQRPPANLRELEEKRVGRDALLPVAAPAIAAGDPLRRGGRRLRVLGYSPYTHSSALIAGLLARLGERVSVVAESPLGETLRALALGGAGLAWLPRSMVARDLASGTLLDVGGGDWTVTMEVCAWRRRDLDHAAALRLFDGLETVP